ncbi:MAG: transglycosylase SLT domain-containing protein [Candidatus Eisenbacteria bacterium]|nr:transglycosylase SLT domain-containing protein [Candidatus Latescibacterota bacterium]MBD3302958.1 transglycosylase SLT domain-containing protein [Candidatus Eisenbacteria bacterium]
MRQHRVRAGVLFLAIVWLGLLFPRPVGADEPVFPEPPDLVPLVDFWVEIFTERSRDWTVLHDRDDPDIRYETVHTGGMSESQRRTHLRNRRRHYAGLLENLAIKTEDRWTEAEGRIAAMFPESADTKRYLEAAGRIRSQRGIRDRFREGLVRSGRWHAAIERILASYEIPTELAVLPHVESSFNPYARSKAGAVGAWQFTAGTGKRYLRIDRHLDERHDIYVSTHAAARYLRDAHAKIGAWPLTVTAYNHGVNGVLRAQRELGTSDIGRMIREYDGPYFGFASKNFYAEFLAALRIARDPDAYFTNLAFEPEEEVDHFVLPSPSRFPALARAFGCDEEELRALNPALADRVVSGRWGAPAGAVINVPRDRVPDLAEAYLALPEGDRNVPIEPDRYRVRWGDTLSSIARKHGVSVADLQEFNGMGRSTRILAGQRIEIPPPPR